ncbi:MAG: hypothetical protein KH354_03520 [Clostridiales bacterium]|nr:hypothetical protein [Clostridiales bacterium]
MAYMTLGISKTELLDKWYVDELFVALDQYAEIKRREADVIKNGGAQEYEDVEDW